MINKITRQQGFTLLELIIVIIIIGVLASLALPRFFKLVEGAKGAEAIITISTIRQAMERCYLMSNGDYSPCKMQGGITGFSTENTLGIDDPSNTFSPSSYFNYKAGVIATPGCQNRIRIGAVRKGGAYEEKIIMGIGARPTVSPLPGVGYSVTYDCTVPEGKVFWDASPLYRGMIPKMQ